MKERFEFETDTKSRDFCEKIVGRMVILFSISVDEAIGRLNRDWKGLRFLGPNDMIYHEGVDDWANSIYYGKTSKWWLNPQNLKARPYP